LLKCGQRATCEGYCYPHVQAIIVAIDQYAEAETDNREYFLNKPHTPGKQMADVATDLKQRFGWAMDVCLEAYEVLPDGRSFERSDRDVCAIGIFERLRNTVDAIPSPLIASAEQLCSVEPKLFEKRLTQHLMAIGSTSSPANAAEFIGEFLGKK
jgi:hypothetical protein